MSSKAQKLKRLFSPRSIAVIGGGAWCRSVIEQCQKAGFDGNLWPVHPKADSLSGLPVFRSITDLPGAPDACFIGVNRHATIDTVAQLAGVDAGGAVCFASGFREAVEEDSAGTGLQDQLVAAAGDMPILGPNCYGFINYLDNALLWPDQHGGRQVDSGVAIITQSSNMAISITMQQRALPIAALVCAGNQAQTGMAEIGSALLIDPRITALGLHIEGIGDIRAFEALASVASELGKPVIALKVGKSEQARAATVSHTASLAGQDAGAQALLNRLNIPRLNSLPEFLETLKLLHMTGPLASNHIASISCSGGEASLAADTATGFDLEFPPLNQTQKTNLREALGPMVALANPLDYHTYIWRDAPAMTKAWAAMIDPSIALTLLIVDFPRVDRCDAEDWDCAITAAIAAKAKTGNNVAMVATLPENMPEDVALNLAANGVVPMYGLSEAFAVAEAAAWLGRVGKNGHQPVLLPGKAVDTVLVSEADSKKQLAAYGVPVPKGDVSNVAGEEFELAESIGYPVAVKVQGYAHKTENNAVALNISSGAHLARVSDFLPVGPMLVEEMISDTVAELLIGVVKDPAHGFVLTLAAGGTLTELLTDSQSLLIPARDEDIAGALKSMRISKLLDGYRGKPRANSDAIVAAVRALQNYVLANAEVLEEVEINPLLCCPDRAVAADALLKRKN
ncbi:MAG: acetate--CoA ligase family protein [Rhodobacteraceae bacterium]|nr:acetate--CoA ligase family protein [Paracoccaceae bacterium]